MLDLRLETYLVLCETRNYTQTASILSITQPAVTQHIKYLEKHYQSKLLYYDERRRLHLTENGRMLRAFAQTVKADSQKIADCLKSVPQEYGEVKIGSLATTAESLVPHMIAEYIRLCPDKKVSMYLGEADTLLEQLRSGRIHFCITDSYCPPDQYESIELFESESVCVCSPLHPFAGKSVDFADLYNYRLIFRENDSNSHRNLMKILHAHNQDVDNFRSYVEMGTINAVKKLVMENIGISFIYRFVVEEELKKGQLCRIHLRHFSSLQHFNFAWMKNSFFAPDSILFLEVCKNVLSSQFRK